MRILQQYIVIVSVAEASMQRLNKYGVHRRSGNAVISAMLPEDFIYINKNVIILEGILVHGLLTKSHVGASHRSIIQELYKKYGTDRTVDFFTDAPRLINKWLIERGFSVGIRDMMNIDDKGRDKNEFILKQELARIYVQLEALGEKMKDPLEESYRQRQIENLVNVAQGIGLRLAKEVLSGDNSIGIMTDQGAGTKGGIANIGQIMGAVGQQNYQGKRLQPKLTGGRRLLPTYDVDDNNPEAHAFIPTSFFTGLSPEALFFLQAGGREGLLDTALKTAETGAMQHRMIKAFENIIIGYDGSVRNTVGTIFLPMYNSGYDVGEMMSVSALGRSDFSSFIDIKSAVNELNVKRGWLPKSVDKLINGKREVLFQEIGNTPDNILPNEKYHKKPLNTRPYDIKEKVIIRTPKIKINKFEKARIWGTRAKQISQNAPILLDDVKGEVDPVNIARMEYEQGLLKDSFIIRKYPNGIREEVHATLDYI